MTYFNIGEKVRLKDSIKEKVYVITDSYTDHKRERLVCIDNGTVAYLADWFERIPSKNKSTLPMLTACIHTWVEYVGFTDTYEYCEKCDKKKEKL